jgi:hypothetical protein
MRWINFFSLPYPSGCSGIYSASYRNEHQKQKHCFWGIERCRCVGLTSLPPSVNLLSRQCGIPNISQPCRPPRRVTMAALLFTTEIASAYVFCLLVRSILILYFYIHLSVSSDVLPGFCTKIEYTLLLCSVGATCLAHLIVFGLIALILRGEVYKLWRFSLCRCLQLPGT